MRKGECCKGKHMTISAAKAHMKASQDRALWESTSAWCAQCEPKTSLPDWMRCGRDIISQAGVRQEHQLYDEPRRPELRYLLLRHVRVALLDSEPDARQRLEDALVEVEG